MYAKINSRIKHLDKPLIKTQHKLYHLRQNHHQYRNRQVQNRPQHFAVSRFPYDNRQKWSSLSYKAKVVANLVVKIVMNFNL